MRERDAVSWTGHERRRGCGRVQRGCGEDTGNGGWGSPVWSSWRVGGVDDSVAGAERSPWWVTAGLVAGNAGVRRACGDGTGNEVWARACVGCRLRGGTGLCRFWSGNGGVCE
jgi:hypothetical protein